MYAPTHLLPSFTELGLSDRLTFHPNKIEYIAVVAPLSTVLIDQSLAALST